MNVAPLHAVQAHSRVGFTAVEESLIFSPFSIRYDDVVDLDVYRYFVIRIREKSTFFYISINGKALKVGYTTGIHAQDLRALGLRGKQRVGFYGQFLNSHGHVKLDCLRLVRALTPEEQKGLIGEGLTVRDENLSAHPYHRLEALNARAGRPSRPPGQGSEWVVYRDTGTGAEVWKMTDLAANECQVSFNCDGSAFTVRGRPGQGFHVFDWTDRRFKLIKGGLSDARPRFSTTEPDAMVIAENIWLPRRPGQPRRRITIWRQNFRTDERTKLASFHPQTWVVQEFSSSPDSAKMVFGLRESCSSSTPRSPTSRSGSVRSPYRPASKASGSSTTTPSSSGTTATPTSRSS